MKVIFLDLDKTLIGDDYSPEPAKPIIEKLKKLEFKIIFNSSKTRAEQEYYREALNIKEPFIVENGSAVYIPKDYFPFNFKFTREDADYYIIELGKRYPVIKKTLDKLSEDFGLKYYGNSSIDEVMKFTNLPRKLARLAMIREYSETIFRWEKEGFERALERNGLKVVKGSRFYNVTGKTDKGKATKIILSLYSKIGKIESYAVGDGLNDVPMLDVVDFAFIVGDLKHPNAKNIRSIKEILEVME